jgi:hypothetical protein
VVYDITSRQSWKNVKSWVEDVRRWLSEHESMIPFIVGTCALVHHHRDDFIHISPLNRSLPCGLLAVVGAKSDLNSQRQVSVEEGKALADEVGAIGWTEVSSLTGANGKQPMADG